MHQKQIESQKHSIDICTVKCPSRAMLLAAALIVVVDVVPSLGRFYVLYSRPRDSKTKFDLKSD